jgi:hypothetical protein
MDSSEVFGDDQSAVSYIGLLENSKQKVSSAPTKGNNLKKHKKESNEESKEHSSNSSKVGNFVSRSFKSENERENFYEGGQDNAGNRCETEDNLMEVNNTPDEEDEEDKKEEDKNSEESKNADQPPAQDDKCNYSQLKKGEEFYFKMESYNLKTSDLYLGSKVRLAIADNIIFQIKNKNPLVVTQEGNSEWRHKVKIADAVILPPLEKIEDFWSEERNLFESEWKDLLFPKLRYDDKSDSKSEGKSDSKRMCGNLIFDHWVKDKLSLYKLISEFKNKKLSDYEEGFTLYEVKEKKLIAPIDKYIKRKPLEYQNQLQFKFKNHESNQNKDSNFTELYYKSSYEDDDSERI